ncbi:MAG TPA: DUF5666 domain-containing protein [Burkholderiaceae bacterium]|jgi:hypothetical protein
MKIRLATWSFCVALLAAVTACGGGSGGDSMSSSSGPTDNMGGGATISGTAPGATSSGAITAFGSVFVNGHEYDISKASVVDDDTGASMSSSSSLEVGQVVDVKVASSSSDSAPAAQSLHLHPLVRGYVDASDSSSITVMGQSVQLSGTTVFSDHRACVFAATNPCDAVDGVSDLGVTAGSGASATPGSYVVVDGYLFNSGSAVNVVASLVAVFDAPSTNAGMAAFKAEGSVSAVSGSTVTIGALSVNLASAKCYASGASTACASAFSVGQVVSAFASASPSLPAASFSASAALLRDRLPVTTAGAVIELQGGVSAVSSSPASFTLRGISIDATALPAGTALPVVGDIVRVLGTVSTSGTSVAATSLQILRAAASASYAFQGDVSSVAAGSASNTYTLTLLGQTITVNSQTRFADFSIRNWFGDRSSSKPFNISTFQTYLAASSSQHLIVRTAADASGNLQALSVTIVRASAVSGVAGVVDASPAPVNSTVTGTPSTFSIHGMAVSADPHAIQLQRRVSAISVGDEVLAVGTYANGALSVSASRSFGNFVLDSGPPRQQDCPGF